MRRTYHWLLVAFCLLVVSAGAQSQMKGEKEMASSKTGDYSINAKKLDQLDEVIEKHIESKIYPGAVVVVGRPDKIYFEKAYGKMTYADDAAPMTLDTMFDLASVSKVVGTATTTMILIDEGKISLDDPVSKYIPGFDSGGKEGDTVKDLLTHVSGLKAYESVDKIKAEQKEGESNADALIRHVAALDVKYKPRTDYTYSCLNFLTLARFNQNAAGERQEDILKKSVWKPLGMDHTAYVLTEKQLENTAPTIKRDDGDFRGPTHDPLANYHGSEGYCPGNAGLFSTGPDLAKYCSMILSDGKYDGKQIIKAKTVEMMTQDQTPEAVTQTRGLGFDIYDDIPYSMPQNNSVETLTFGHSGYTGTLIWLDKNSKTFIVFLTNRVYPDDKATVSQARRDVIKTVLGSMEPYQKVLIAEAAKKEKEEKAKVSAEPSATKENNKQ